MCFMFTKRGAVANDVVADYGEVVSVLTLFVPCARSVGIFIDVAAFDFSTVD